MMHRMQSHAGRNCALKQDRTSCDCTVVRLLPQIYLDCAPAHFARHVVRAILGALRCSKTIVFDLNEATYHLPLHGNCTSCRIGAQFVKSALRSNVSANREPDTIHSRLIDTRVPERRSSRMWEFLKLQRLSRIETSVSRDLRLNAARNDER